IIRSITKLICILRSRQAGNVTNKVGGPVYILCETSFVVLVNEEIKPLTVQGAVFGEVPCCVVDGDSDVVQRIDSVLCQSLSDQVSHGCCTKWLPRFFSVAQPRA